MNEIEADLRSKTRSKILLRLGLALALACTATLDAQAAPRPMPPGMERTGTSLSAAQAAHIRNATIKPPGHPSGPPPALRLSRAATRSLHH